MDALFRGRGCKWVPVVAIFMLALSACGSGENPALTPGGKSPAAKSEEHKTIGGADVIVRGRAAIQTGAVNLEVDDDYFKPNILTGTPGTKVTASIKNEGQRKHNFSLKEQLIDQDIEPGGSTSVVFTFPQSGTLTFFCKYHGDTSGMKGELEAS